MLRILLTIAVGACVGWGLGHLQASMSTSGFEERFSSARTTLSESTGQITTEELAALSTGTPKLEVVGGNEFRFGTMQHGDSMSHTFVFRNIGDGPLTLDLGGSTCKCTVGRLKSSVLNPGEETDVTLTWTPVAANPDFSQSATIHTNAADTPEVQLSVRGQVAGSFVIEPPELALGDISVTDTVTRKFHVFTYLERSTELKDFRWSDARSAEKIKLTARKIELDPEEFPEHRSAFSVHEVDVTIEPGLQLGLLSSQITFTTDLEEQVGTLELPVTGRVAGDFTFVGGPSYDSRLNVLKFGTVKSSEGAEVGMSLVVQGDQRDQVAPEVVTVRPSDALTVTVGEPKLVGERKYFPLKFEVPKGAPETHFSGASPKDFGSVVLKTNHDLVKEISIHVQLNVVK
ncbi:MAG: DUF1573 domain-containing protein [Pirellulaceae bacterium]|jgi:hypothetical protein|nr:DUF1573 domain-containing protein [Pirellulaceae bacterium]